MALWCDGEDALNEPRSSMLSTLSIHLNIILIFMRLNLLLLCGNDGLSAHGAVFSKTITKMVMAQLTR